MVTSVLAILLCGSLLRPWEMVCTVPVVELCERSATAWNPETAYAIAWHHLDGQWRVVDYLEITPWPDRMEQAARVVWQHRNPLILYASGVVWKIYYRRGDWTTEPGEGFPRRATVDWEYRRPVFLHPHP